MKEDKTQILVLGLITIVTVIGLIVLFMSSTGYGRSGNLESKRIVKYTPDQTGTIPQCGNGICESYAEVDTCPQDCSRVGKSMRATDTMEIYDMECLRRS